MSAGPATPGRRAVVFGYHNVGARCLETMLDQGLDVALVVTHDDDPGETIWFDSVRRIAEAHAIPAIAPPDPNAPEVIDQVRAARPDFLFSFYYRRMLGPELLSIAPRGAFNMHGSLLPRYRGRVPVNWAIIKGETETGATLHEMVAKPDAGRIVDQEAVPIGPDDIAIEVFDKVTGAATRVLARSLPALVQGTAVLRTQDLRQGSYFSGRRPEDGRIDWHQDARAIHNLVRAVAPPYPGAFCDLAGHRLRVLRTRLAPERQPQPGGPGLYSTGGRLFADCADGTVLELLQIEGGPAAWPVQTKIPFEQVLK